MAENLPAVIRNPKYSTWAAPITDLETFIRSPYCWNLSNTIFRCSLCSSSVDEATKVHHQDTENKVESIQYFSNETLEG
ncbi:hypothetical protein TNCV_805631 [Trichonephila clavipes]|nr:hypothetical protein TNCV_805631 [Trichonephila clavipes]